MAEDSREEATMIDKSTNKRIMKVMVVLYTSKSQREEVASSISKESMRASNPRVKATVAEVALEDQSRAVNTRRRKLQVVTQAVDILLTSTMKNR